MATILEQIRRFMGINSIDGNPSNSIAINRATGSDNLVDGIMWEARSHEELARLYTSLVEIRIIEDYISKAIAKIPIKVYRGDREIVSTSALSKLEEKANPNQLFTELIEEALVFYGLTGNSFITVNNGYLYNLATHDIDILLALGKDIPQHLNFVAGYQYEYGGQYYNIEADNTSHLKTTQLLHRNGMWAWGTSPYAAAIPNLDLLESLYSSRIGMVNDRGALGILTNKSQIPSKEATELVQEALLEYGTRRGQKKYIATPEDLEWQQMSLNTRELQLLEQSQADFTRLCEVRGIDANVFSAEESTYANQYAAVENTYRRAIIPTTKRFYAKLKPFTERHFNGLHFRPDLEYVPEMADTQTKQSVKVMNEVKAGVLTREQGLKILYPDLKFEGVEQSEMMNMGMNEGGRPSIGGQNQNIQPNTDNRVNGGSQRILNN